MVRAKGSYKKSAVLRVADGDGGGGMTAEKMVKYTPSDDGKNGQF